MAAPSRDRANLLGIPTELRLSIYEYVLGLDIVHSKSDQSEYSSGPAWEFSYGDTHRARFRTNFIRGNDTPLRIPWLSLQSTCSAIHGELKEHMRKSLAVAVATAADSTEEDTVFYPKPCHTYKMQIEAKGGRLVEAVWSAIPCSPSQCRILTARITLQQDVRFGCDGGPMPIVRELYQTLNRFPHYGPHLSSKTPLPSHVVLDVLRLVVRVVEERVEELEWFAHRAEDMRRAICGFAQRLESTGLLNGFAERIAVVVDSREGGESRLIDDILVERRGEPGKVPDYWDGYGFEWGVSDTGNDNRKESD